MLNITYTWGQVSVIDSQTTNNELQLRHIIKKLWFVRQGTDANGNVAEVKEIVTLSDPDPNNYTSIKSLNRENFISWIENTLEPIKLQEIDQQIANKLQEINTRNSRLSPEMLELVKNSIPPPLLESDIIVQDVVIEPTVELDPVPEPQLDLITEGQNYVHT